MCNCDTALKVLSIIIFHVLSSVKSVAKDVSYSVVEVISFLSFYLRCCLPLHVIYLTGPNQLRSKVTRIVSSHLIAPT